MKGFADCHIHIRNGRFEEIEKMFDEVHSMGVTDACLAALPYRSVSENISALYWKTKYKKIRLTAFCGLHLTDRYAEVPYEKQVEKFLELGCDGIKLIDMHPEVIEFTKKFISHPSYDAMFSLLEERGTPVLLHANDPKECWEMPDNTVIDGLSIYRGAYYGKNLPSFDDIYNETLKVVKKHPNLNFIIAHFFFLSSDIDRAVYVMETYPNVRFDLTPGTDMFFHFMKKPEKWHDFFTKYQDRILFGTDSNTYKDFNKEINQLVYTFLSHDYTPFTMPCYGNFTICGLGLSQEVLNKICYTNYLDVTGHEIKPVNVEGIYEAAYSIYKEMKEKPNDPQYDAVSKIFKDLSLDPKQQIAIDFFERLLNESSSSNPMQ